MRPRHQRGQMNATEAAYSHVLAERLLSGEIIHWDFEPETLVLAKNTRYTPDFRVVLANGEIEFHEVKVMTSGGKVLREDDAWVKLKMAADIHWMYRFVGAWRKPKKQGGVFVLEVIEAR